jgi:hypothetical protein
MGIVNHVFTLQLMGKATIILFVGLRIRRRQISRFFFFFFLVSYVPFVASVNRE